MNEPYLLTDQQRSVFSRNGFLSLDSVTTAEDIGFIRGLITEILEESSRGKPMPIRDLGDDAAIGHDVQIMEVVSPAQLAPRLLESRLFQTALAISRQVCGPSARLLFDHCIAKPAFNRKATAWHQDCAYARRVTFSACRLHWWLPLQEATEENGCMQFVPGSHQGRMLPHAPLTVRAHALAAPTPDAAEITVCPLPVGGATVHLPKTLHYTGPNNTAAPRLAWIIQIGVKTLVPTLMR